MQFIDIAVASGYAAVCLALIVTMNPVIPRETAVEAGAQTRLDSSILAYIEGVGLPFLATATPPEVCASAAQATNSTVAFDVVVGGAPCASPPGSPLASDSLTLHLPGRTVLVEAWLERQ